MYGYLFQSHFRSYMALFHPVRLLKSKQFEKKMMMKKKIFYLQKILWLKKTTFIVSLGANF